MVVISCAYPECDYQSEDVTEPIACVLLQSHSFSHATAASAVQAAVPAPVTENRGTRLERPSQEAPQPGLANISCHSE